MQSEENDNTYNSSFIYGNRNAAYNTTINIYGNGKLAENLSDFKVYLSNLKVNGKEVSGINNTKDGFTINDINGTLEYEITNDSTEYDTESYLECDIDNTWDFDYAGGEQTFIAPTTGTYKLETWGAQGGSINETYYGGYGAYSLGNIKISQNDKLYINIGGQGSDYSLDKLAPGGYNGGGYGGVPNTTYSDRQGGCGGGGATHIAITSGLLSSFENKKEGILIVAGGGGGGASVDVMGSDGGGYKGNDGGYSSLFPTYHGTGGTQTIGGFDFTINSNYGTFGQGSGFSDNVKYGGNGGGGGFYGGGGTNRGHSGGGGGSGYIGNSLLTEKSMYCYKCAESNETSTKTISTTCTRATPTANCAKQGNGYARITLMTAQSTIATDTVTITAQENASQSLENITGKSLTCKLKLNKVSRTEKKVYNGPTEWVFDYTGGEQTFTAPVSGTYKLEVWGAQGGSGSFNNYSNDKAGYGGYSLGLISINLSSKIYINVGGAGGVVNSINGSAGGYNGGGNGEATCEGFKYPGGGGATHISGTSGILPTLSNKIDNIIIVAGGGGGAGLYNGGYNQSGGYAGSGGGFAGGAATTTNLRPIIGGTQTTGYSFGLGETSVACHYAVDGNWGNGGGGGGFYGGFASGYTTGAYTNGGGAGGSGYIGNSLLNEKTMYCYNCTESSETSTKTISTTCVNSNPIENCAKSGNGYARITLISY